ncbi:DUF3606 domain-containing protein [Rhodoligotrophos defluvii]|uniref:DUF3606 domain-containing protein n=1 Tax=Rhodoligotrophos defluvii TaxID=2561934 RepID=UPI0010C99EFB|nr:DUF3606 domain-containing protein [Rhodoligotrophos defluvii]
MEDHRPRRGPRDLSGVTDHQPYEVRDLAERFGLPLEQVRQLVDTLGDDPRRLEEAARKLKIEAEEGQANRPRSV